MTEHTLTIPARFNGPPDSANGGYCCGALAAFVDGVARVRLASPPPLDTTLTVTRQSDGTVELRDGDALVGSASRVSLHLDVPAAPSINEAREASKSYIGFSKHELPGCYVCGPGRDTHDGMDLFVGEVPDSGVYACPWSPRSDQLNPGDGNVRREVIWAALDCPGYFALYGRDVQPALLGELTAEIVEPIAGDGEYVVFAWPISRSGRKLIAGTAIADSGGLVLAMARATWIQLKD